MKEHENENRLIAEFDKNSMEMIKVHLTRWHDTDYVDVRVWVKGDPGHPGADQPTTKGVRLNAELLPELRSALDMAIKALEDGPVVEIVRDGGQGAGESR